MTIISNTISLRVILFAVSTLLYNFAQAQISAVGVLPGHPGTATIYQAPAGNYANFPRGLSMDVADGTPIVKKVLVSFAKNPDNAPATLTARIASMDGGITWGGYQAYNNDFPLAIRRRDGIMTTLPFNQSGGPGTYNITYWTSPLHSNGASWSPTPPASNTGTIATNMQGHRSIIEDDNGDLYATGYQTDVKLIKSTNGGANWTLVAIPFDGTQPNDYYSEPALERCADGSWLMVARRDNPGLGMRWSRSTNKGLTWTAPAPLVGVGIQSGFSVDVDPHLQLMPNGVLVLSYGSRKSDFRYATTRVAFSLDHGATWTNITDTKVGVLTSGVQPGGLTTGYTAAIPVSAHRFIQVGDTGSNRFYASDMPSPNPYSIWGKYIDVVRTNEQNRIDLKARYAQSQITIMPATNLTYTDAAHPEARTTGAFDGSTDYWSGALGTTTGVYQLDLLQTFRIKTIGLSMLYGKTQTATVELSPDGTNWTPKASYSGIHYCLNYQSFAEFSARYVRVTVSGTGQVGLGELELYEASNTFENNAVAASTNAHGILPTGYVKDSDPSTPNEWGFSVQDGQGHLSNRALKLWDGSSTWRAGIKKIVTGGNLKTLEFRCRIATLPVNTSFSIPIFGTVSGVEGTTFRLAVFAPASGTNALVKYFNGTSWIQIGTATLPISSTWSNIKIEANESANTATLSIGGVVKGSFPMSVAAASATNLTGFGFYSNGTPSFGEIIYFDDVNFYDPAVGGSSGIASIAPQEQLLLINSTEKTLVSDNNTPGTETKIFSISASPNPANGLVKLTVQNSIKGALDIHITNTFGKTVKKINHNAEGGTVSLEVPVGEFARGVYIIRARQNGKISTTKLIVDH